MVNLKLSLDIYVGEKDILFKDLDGERKYDISVIKNPTVADMLSYYDEIHIKQLPSPCCYIAILLAHFCCCLRENGTIHTDDPINPAILCSTNACLNRWEKVSESTKSLGQSFGRLVTRESCFMKTKSS